MLALIVHLVFEVLIVITTFVSRHGLSLTNYTATLVPIEAGAGRDPSWATLQIAALDLLPVEFDMLKLHVLVHGAFGTVGLVTASYGASVVSLNLSGRPPMSLSLVIQAIHVDAFVPVVMSLIGRAQISLHLRGAVLVETLSQVAYFLGINCNHGLDLRAKHRLLYGAIRTALAAATTSTMLASVLFKHHEVLVVWV